MYDEVRHLQGLVQDLRTLSLADAGNLTLTQEEVDPQQLLQRTAATYQQRAHAQDVQVVVATDDALPLVQVDPERMIQVLGNLVSNALRFTPVGGCIQLKAHGKGEQVELLVTDNGVGIAPEHLPRIFDRFYQADSARSEEEYNTSGLGLAIVKSIVELHQGTISVTSTLNQGTTFTISLAAMPA
jgi:two-component system sensor histidine kinase BaeS